MNLPSCIPEQADAAISGTFTTLEQVARTTRMGKPFLELVLADESGSIPAYCLKTNDRTITSLGDTYTASIQGRVRLRPRGWVVEVDDADEYWPQFASFDEALRLLAPNACPQPDALAQFKHLVRGLQITPLRNFVHSAISDDRIARPFLQVPASVDHHHQEDGGLLVHSVDCAKAAVNFPHLGDPDRELALVGALFHDIGKIKTLACGGQRTSTGFLIDHDALTLEILSSHLSFLQSEWPEGAEALRYIWTWQSGFNKERYPRLMAAEAVRAADRFSVAADARALAFEGHPDWHKYASLDGYGPVTRFWRVMPPK